MKKFLVLILFACCSILPFLSCTKNNDVAPKTYSMVGLWRGTYSVDGQPELGQQELNLIIKPDGTMDNDSKAGPQQHFSTGTWTLVGDTAFSCTATCVYGYSNSIGQKQKHTAIFNKTTGKLTSGVWINLPPVVGSGTFTLTKVE